MTAFRSAVREAGQADADDDAADAAVHRARSARAPLAHGVGGCSVGTGEFAIMGWLPEVARDLGTTIS